MIFPKTYIEILNLLNKIPEDIHLEYKSGQAIDFSKVAEMSKDVSAFANSDGGVLIYGVQEDKSTHLPVSIDGVDSKKYSHEWLENVIKSNINPIIPDYEIKPIKIKGKPNLVIYSILIPKSYRTPHQAKDKKYYKRYNFKSEAMENYEIDDIRNRKQVVPSLVNISAIRESLFTVYLEVENTGNHTAKDIKFEIPNELEIWIEEQQANLFKAGIKFLPPKQKYRFRYGFIHQILHESSKIPNQFEISVNYEHPLYSQRISESFGIDLLSYWGNYAEVSDVHRQGENIEKVIKELNEQLKKVNSHFSELTNITNSSGLNLSFTTLRNLSNIIEKKEINKFNPIGQNYLFFMEVLGLHWRIAHELEDYFRRSNKSDKLSEVKGLDDEIIERIKSLFVLDSEEIEE